MVVHQGNGGGEDGAAKLGFLIVGFPVILLSLLIVHVVSLYGNGA